MVVFFAPTDVWTQPNDLLVPVPPSEAMQVKAKNQYYVKKYLYLAQRYRMVRVRTDLLLTAEKVRIPLFDGQSLIFNVTRLKTDDTRASIRWRGKLAAPPFSAKDLLARAPSIDSLKQAEFIHDAYFSIYITAARYDFHPGTGLFMPSVDYLKRILCDDPPDTKKKPRSVYGVTMDITIPGLKNEYRLESLTMSPGYHLFIEVDQSKIAPPGPLIDPEHPEMAARRRAWSTFLQSLGDDPRGPAEEEFRRSIRQGQYPDCE